MKQKLILALAVLVPLVLLAVHPLPQVAQTNAPFVVGGTNQIVWHDLRQTNRVWLAKPKKGRHLEALAAIGKFSKKQKHLTHVGLIRFETDEHNPKSKIPTNLVEYVVPDRLVQIQDVIPNDPLWTNQWDMAKIQMPAAWGISTGSSNVIVAVIDTGIDFTHPDLQGSLWSNPTNGTHGYQCYGGVLQEGGADVFGHGTHAAGTIGAVGNNALGMAGENWTVNILSMAFLDKTGSGFLSDAITLIDKLIELKRGGQNIRVASNSWGGTGADQSLTDAFQHLEEAGILSACASGNDTQNIDLVSDFPAGQTNRGIISVNASDASDELAWFSNFGLVNTDIAAPGVKTLSTLPASTNIYLHSTNGYGLLSGTSMATPHVAGVAALLAAKYPGLTVYQLKDVLLNHTSGDVLPSVQGGLSTTGARLNAYRALTNPLASSPRLNSPPVIYPNAISNTFGGQTVSVSFTAQDADGDPLRYAIFDTTGFVPFAFTNRAGFIAPYYAIPVAMNFYEEVADGNGGADLKTAVGNILVEPGYTTDRYEVTVSASVLSTNQIGFRTDYLTNGNPAIVARRIGAFSCQRGGVGWVIGEPGAPVGNDYEVWNVSVNDSFRLFTVAKNDELTLKESQRVLFRFGASSNEANIYPDLVCRFDKTVGPAPLAVNYDFSATIGSNGPYSFTEWLNFDRIELSTRGTMSFDTPGVYQVLFTVADGQAYTDAKMVAFSALAPATTNGPPPPPPPQVILNQVTNLSATASGGTASLRWTDNSTGEDRYLMEASRKSKGSWVVWQTSEIPANLSSYAYRPAQSGFYRFRVRAAFQLQYSPWSLPSNQVKL